jgi:hypothetical protein
MFEACTCTPTGVNDYKRLNVSCPVHSQTSRTPPEPVETLRDRFAMAALANHELCTGRADEYYLALWFPGQTGITRFQIAAKQASLYADACMAEREKPHGR